MLARRKTRSAYLFRVQDARRNNLGLQLGSKRKVFPAFRRAGSSSGAWERPRGTAGPNLRKSIAANPALRVQKQARSEKNSPGSPLLLSGGGQNERPEHLV